MTDRVGVQMLHHSRLLFRLIGGRSGESPRHPDRLYGSFSAGAWLQARVARSSYLLAISRIVCSSRASRISFAMARACAATSTNSRCFPSVHLSIERPRARRAATVTHRNKITE